MKSIENTINRNYWSNKIKDQTMVNNTPLELLETQELIFSPSDISYFGQLTGGNQNAEFTVLLGIYNMLLQRYFDPALFIFSTGFTKNKKPLLYQQITTENKILKEFLNELKEEVKQVYKYMDYEETVLDENHFINYASFTFLFNDKIQASNKIVPFNLVFENKENFHFSIFYDPNFVEPAIAEHFLKIFGVWLKNLKLYLNKEINKIPVVTPEEKKQLLEEYNIFNADEKSQQTLLTMFEAQVPKSPDQVAVCFEKNKLTYLELNNIANQLAEHLNSKYNILPNDFVGIKLERSEKLLISILAVLKTGAAYVPIDVNYPTDRIAYIESDSNYKCLIDTREFDRFLEFKNNYKKENQFSRSQPDQTAYIIYTSGTTGNPKGVMITHRNAATMVRWAQREYAMDGFEIAYAPTSHCFDLSIYEMFYPLSIGKTIRMFNSALDIKAEIEQDQKILLNLVPSSMRHLLDKGCSLENVSFVNLAGEPFPVDIANKLLKTKAEIRNLYGPSEDTTYSTCYKLSADKTYQSSIPIGKPILNTRAYILNQELELVPPGVPGKLFLSGDGIAKGYLNRPELTNERFLQDPFHTEDIMYDTGDLAKWLPDGNIAFLGRKDFQVKLRGYRIELGEIEHRILTFSNKIEQAVVAVKEHLNEKVLVAYYVENTTIDKNKLIEFLKQKMPAYMIPAFFVQIEKIPLTPNGKVNKAALPEINSDNIITNNYIAPVDELEKSLVAIWESVLGFAPIGLEDRFFDLGGHSLMISQIINTIHKELNLTVPHRVFYGNPTIRAIKNELQKQTFKAIPKATSATHFPVTPAQNRMWLMCQFPGANLAYNIPFVFQLKGNLNVSIFQQAVELLIKRHEAFRTYFGNGTDGEVLQFVLRADEVIFELDKQDFTEQDNGQSLAEEYLERRCKETFDLSEAPLVKAAILKVEKERHLLYISMHHIIGDGWSMQVLISELRQSYNALLEGKEAELTTLDIQYKDYTLWQLQQFESEKIKQAEKYWVDRFSDEIPVLDLPAYQSRPLVKTYTGQSIQHQYSKEFLIKLKQFAQERETTLFTVLMAGLKVLLHRYTGQNDIIIGVPVAGREHPDLENQVGLYLNTLAIRTKLDGLNDFEDLLAYENKVLSEAFANQVYPFDKLIGELDLKKDISRSALFDVMLVLQNQEQLENLETENEFTGLKMSEYFFDDHTTHFDLSLLFRESDELMLTAMYNTDIYNAGLIENLFLHFETIMNILLDNSKTSIRAFNYLPEEGITNTEISFEKYQKENVITLFERQVSQTPDAVAIQYEEISLTYEQLNKKANQLAHLLRKRIKPIKEKNIGALLGRSHWNVIAMLGIIKSGAVYVPIDAKYQDDRKNYIIENAGINTLVSLDEYSDINTNNVLEVILLDQLDDLSTTDNNPELLNDLDDTSFIIYTSGSTGNPKGVIQTHRMLSNLIQWNTYDAKIESGLKHLQYTSFSFDVSLQDCWFVLSTGGTLFIAPESMKIDFISLSDYIIKKGIEVLCFPYSAMVSFVEYLEEDFYASHQVKHIISSGEQLTVNQALQNLLEKFPDLKLHNHYGPAEAHVVTSYTLTAGDGIPKHVPIGKPISNTSIYLLDKNLQPIPKIVIGEIYIGGANLAKGYVNLPQLTHTRFITHPFDSTKKLYKTGDLAYLNEDGILIYLGRNDNQVKIRGYRIELAEIKNTLLIQENINQVYVDVIDRNNEKAIVAYISGEGEMDKVQIRNGLKKQLPDYMLPSYILLIDHLPLTSNGKINKAALPEVKEADLIKAEFLEATTTTEKQLVEIWKEILSLSKLGVLDNFFELGGHSLHITRMLYQINEQFSIHLQMNDVFSSQTIQELAQLIDEEIIFKKGITLNQDEIVPDHQNSEVWEI